MAAQTNVADEAQVKQATQKEKSLLEREQEDMKYLLTLPAGRRFLWRLLAICRINQISFTGNSETFYNEGHRNVGNKVLAAILDADPDAYLKMIKENRKGDE